MDAIAILADGYSVRLTGYQVRFIRSVLNESQEAFGKRFAVTQPIIYRLEKKREPQTGPLIILIDALAKQYAIQVPEEAIRKSSAPVAAAAQ